MAALAELLDQGVFPVDWPVLDLLDEDVSGCHRC